MFAIYLEKALSRGDGCDWYFLNFVSEIIFVLFFSYLLHSAIVYFAEKNDILVLQSGVYLSVHDAQYLYLYSYEDLDKHINYRVWTIQFIVWLIISTLAKIIQFAIEVSFAGTLIDGAMNLLKPLNGSMTLKIFVVVIVIPVVLNSI